MAWVDADYARSVVKQMYPNDTWRRRVRGMSDEQVLAIYYRWEEDRCKRRNNKLTSPVEKITKEEVKETESQFTPNYAEQLVVEGIF